jgi:hypothetical protein
LFRGLVGSEMCIRDRPDSRLVKETRLATKRSLIFINRSK